MLPTELALYIVKTAAHEYRFLDRQCVVNLAMCNHTVYNIVAPILYHTLLVSQNNVDLLSVFASSAETRALAQRMLSHVRSIHNRSSNQIPFNPRLLVNFEHVTASSSSFLSSWTPPKLRSVHLLNANFSSTLRGLTPDVLRTITHVCGHLPARNSSWTTFFTDPAGWTRSLLERLPAVTHLGLTHYLPRARHYDASVALFDCTVIETVVRAALEASSRIQCIAIRTCGLLSATRRMDLEVVLRDLHDLRIRAWFDMRPMKNWDDYRALGFSDVKEGRNIWTEARPL